MIRIDKYTEVDRGADPKKEYYIDQDGTRLSLTKVELEKIACDLNLLGIAGVVGQSEQLLALAQYMCQHQNNLDGKTAKDYLQDFLSQ